MTKEQTEYFLHLIGTLVEQQERQAVALESIITVLGAIDGQIMDLSYHIRYGGGS